MSNTCRLWNPFINLESFFFLHSDPRIALPTGCSRSHLRPNVVFTVRSGGWVVLLWNKVTVTQRKATPVFEGKIAANGRAKRGRCESGIDSFGTAAITVSYIFFNLKNSIAILFSIVEECVLFCAKQRIFFLQ